MPFLSIRNKIDMYIVLDYLNWKHFQNWITALKTSAPLRFLEALEALFMVFPYNISGSICFFDRNSLRVLMLFAFSTGILIGEVENTSSSLFFSTFRWKNKALWFKLIIYVQVIVKILFVERLYVSKCGIFLPTCIVSSGLRLIDMLKKTAKW